MTPTMPSPFRSARQTSHDPRGREQDEQIADPHLAVEIKITSPTPEALHELLPGGRIPAQTGRDDSP